MIERNRTARIVFGIFFTIAFAVFAYFSCRVAVHSSEVDPSSPSYDSDYGYDRDRFVNSGRTVKPLYYVPYTPQTETPMTDEEYLALLQQLQDSGMDISAAPGAELLEAAPAAEPEALSPAAQRALEKGLPAPPDINIYDWQYTLINIDHILPDYYEPEEKAYLNMTGDDTIIKTEYDPNRQVVDLRIAQALVDFAQGCKAAGLPVYLSSGYRSYSEQYNSYQNKISQYNQDVARFIVAQPGTSEHQSGLCCDITDIYRNPKDKSIAATATFQWLEAHCAEYGFILRYPENKSGDSDNLSHAAESITEVIYEPWHFRYVGVEAATYIMQNDLCLEEFWELYVPGTIPAEKLGQTA